MKRNGVRTLSKRNPYDPVPEGLRKYLEKSQKLTERLRPILESQERFRAMTLPLEQMSTINSQIMNYKTQVPHVSNTSSKTVWNGNPAAEMASTFVEPVGLAALPMANLQIDTSALQLANKITKILPPDYMANIQGVLESYSTSLAAIQSPFLDWLQTVDISPLTQIWEGRDTGHLLGKRYKELQKLHLQVMYKAKWFPYASTLADDRLFLEINQIISSSKIDVNVSKRCEKRIDKSVLSYYNKAEIKRIKKRWNDLDLAPYLKKALGQTLEAYLRKEYALVIPFLATMWEGIIKSKVGRNTKQLKEDFNELVDKNGYDQVFRDFYNNLIIATCYGVKDVVDGVPNRHGVAHSWYIKYPSQKAALNAILLTDFLLSLKPKSSLEDQEDG